MQHAHPEKPSGNKPVAIEINGEPQGVVVREDRGFRFLAVRYDAFAIDGQVFPSVEAARAAVGEALGGFRPG
jgi:hypothetical protein